MDAKNQSSKQCRRRFLSTVMPAGALVCFGCSSVPVLAGSKDQHKFLKDSGMSFKEVYEFAYKKRFIPIMQNLADDIGRDNFIAMLKKASSKAAAQNAQKMAQDSTKHDLAAFMAAQNKQRTDRHRAHTQTVRVVEYKTKAIGLKITECLYAKIFREADASDIGYAYICHPNYAASQAFNPKIRLIRSKTLMQGHDCCNHRWVLEA